MTGRCECRGECGRHPLHLEPDGRCGNLQGGPAIGTGTPVELADTGGAVMCQRCGLVYRLGYLDLEEEGLTDG